MSPSPNVPARSIRCGAISSSAGSAPRRSAAPESTRHETIRGALRSARRQAWHLRGPLCSQKTEIVQGRPPMTPTPRVAFIPGGGTLAYLGLAILGWGSFAAFFPHPPLIALVVVGFVLTGVAL